jgi:hypothetical protein
MLELYNPTANPVTYQLIVGADSPPSGAFIDKRILPNTEAPNVLHVPPYQVIGPVTSYMCPDLSGTEFEDPYGNPWLALQRVSLTVSIWGTLGNQLQVAVPGGPIYGSFGPGVQVFKSAGEFEVYCETAYGNFWVFEVYQAIAPTSVAYQPPK